MLKTLQLTQFRSYKNGLFEFTDGVNIIVGPNASGKTNLLEAIHTIATMHGFRSKDANLLRNDNEWARLEALMDENRRVVKLRDQAQSTLEIDGEVYKRISPKTTMPVVVFEPEHMLLLGGETEKRRAYLDTILSKTVSGYASTLRAYKRSLAQRNKLLKRDMLSQDEVFIWDIQLAEKAGILVSERQKLCVRLQKLSRSIYQDITKSKDQLTIRYSSKLPTETYSDAMLKELKASFTQDRLRGFTGTGPHRDDIEFVLNKRDARIAASRGETRSIVLTLKIAELKILEDTGRSRPILLLDDVFSELDGSRRRALAESLSDYQTFLTTTDADVAVDHFSNYTIIPMS